MSSGRRENGKIFQEKTFIKSDGYCEKNSAMPDD